MLTAAAFFAGAAMLAPAPLERIVGHRGIVVVAPHPDDETLGCGGLIALAHADGRAIKIIVLTDGCGSHPNSRTHLAAAAALGLDSTAVAFLRLSDRALPSQGPEADSAARQIVAAVEERRASAILAKWRQDPHCDHQAAWRTALIALSDLGNDTRPTGTTSSEAERLAAFNRPRLAAQRTGDSGGPFSRLGCSRQRSARTCFNRETLSRFREPKKIYLKAEN